MTQNPALPFCFIKKFEAMRNNGQKSGREKVEKYRVRGK
jgi:hypothetical protein